MASLGKASRHNDESMQRPVEGYDAGNAQTQSRMGCRRCAAMNDLQVVIK
jgi:hypothetical protein